MAPLPPENRKLLRDESLGEWSQAGFSRAALGRSIHPLKNFNGYAPQRFLALPQRRSGETAPRPSIWISFGILGAQGKDGKAKISKMNNGGAAGVRSPLRLKERNACGKAAF